METFGWKQADCYEDLIDLHYFFSLSVKLAFDVFFMIQETGVLLIILEKSSPESLSDKPFAAKFKSSIGTLFGEQSAGIKAISNSFYLKQKFNLSFFKTFAFIKPLLSASAELKLRLIPQIVSSLKSFPYLVILF